MPVTGTIGLRLRAVRRHLGVSATEMALRVGLSGRSSWERYERDQNIPNGEILLQLTLEGINANWVLTGQGGMLGETAPHAVPGIDEEFLMVVARGVIDVHRQEGGGDDLLQLFRPVIRIYSDLMVAYDNTAERMLGLKGMLQHLRRELTESLDLGPCTPSA